MTIWDTLRTGITTRTAAETRALAAELARALPPDSTLALHGDLGVGKTTFVQGLARGLGIRDAVTSPTFNIFTLHRGRTNLLHLDAYRLERAEQVEDLLLGDFMISPWCLAVEWPEKIAGWLPATTLHLELGIAPDERHTLKLC
ncbi:tRNA (adenosine(37)-N6)-threonylcarbamoyltransferase complex ATPase subunit type 1 TsaE [Horticoccus sp. 23ND18S-11]|uniref:tRNA (adenosine(37)-N6)-threonylcarbamoyltransferase complex ATPase subunit type 1 TsaE n=1 Tax=Horticoccus sp. 23ND18S-11 TaxID=3391832 RepID=UPI0039C9217D